MVSASPMPNAMDPVTLAVLRGRLEQIADEMDATLYRSAFNPIIAEAHDACHGLYDAITGDTLIQGKSGLPVFVGAMAFAVRAATPEDEAALARVLDACCCCCSSSGAGGGGGEEGNRIVAKDAFERKTDAGSAELYFHCTFSLSFLDENDARFSLPPFSLDKKNKSKHP